MSTLFRFSKRDVGKSHRIKGQSGDCTVRALVTASGLRYEAAWQLLYEVQGRHKTTGFDLHLFLRLEPETFGMVRQLDFPAVRGVVRMTAPQFAALHPSGSYVLRLAGHASAMEDGVLYDSWDCSDRCIYTAWEIDPAAIAKREAP